jgi:hypothetical protein
VGLGERRKTYCGSFGSSAARHCRSRWWARAICWGTGLCTGPIFTWRWCVAVVAAVRIGHGFGFGFRGELTDEGGVSYVLFEEEEEGGTLAGHHRLRRGAEKGS